VSSQYLFLPDRFKRCTFFFKVDYNAYQQQLYIAIRLATGAQKVGREKSTSCRSGKLAKSLEDPRLNDWTTQPQRLNSAAVVVSASSLDTSALFQQSSQLSALVAAASRQVDSLLVDALFSELVSAARRLLPYCPYSFHLTLKDDPRSGNSIIEQEKFLRTQFEKLISTVSERCKGVCEYVLIRSFSKSGAYHYHVLILSSMPLNRLFTGFPSEKYAERLHRMHKFLGKGSRRRVIGFRSFDGQNNFCRIMIKEHSSPNSILQYALQDNSHHRNFAPELCKSFGFSPIQVSKGFSKLKIHTALRRLLSMRAYLRNDLHRELAAAQTRSEARKQLATLKASHFSSWGVSSARPGSEREGMPSPKPLFVLASLAQQLKSICGLSPKFHVFQTLPDPRLKKFREMQKQIDAEYESFEMDEALFRPAPCVQELLLLTDNQPQFLSSHLSRSVTSSTVQPVMLKLKHGQVIDRASYFSLPGTTRDAEESDAVGKARSPVQEHGLQVTARLRNNSVSISSSEAEFEAV